MKPKSPGLSAIALGTVGLLSAAAQGATPFDDRAGPEVDGFKSYELPAYTIVTHDAGNARPIPRLVAQIDGVLAKLLNRARAVPSSPTYICLVRDSDWTRYLEPGSGIIGEFASGGFANYIVMSNARDLSQVGPGIYHEYTHWFLHTQFGGAHPLWFDEGLASFMSSAQFRDTVVILGEPEESFQLGWIPLKQLLRLDKSSPEYRTAASTDVIHRQSWTIVHRALASDPAFGKQVFGFLDALNTGQPIDDAVQSSFGMSVDKLDADLYAYQSSGGLYLTASNFSVLKLPIEPAPPTRLPAGRPMNKLESLQLFADMMMAFGTHNDRLVEVADAMARANPDAPAAVVLRLRAAALTGDHAGFDRIFRMVEPHAVNAEFTRGVGLAAFDRWRLAGADDPMTAAQRERLAVSSFEALDRAIMSRPDDAEAVWAYALLSAALKRDLPIASRRLKSASAIWPANKALKEAAARLRDAGGQ
jgi:hypothetical protein